MINDLLIFIPYCLISTIIIECFFAFLIKVRSKKDYINIILVNILTNPFVVVLPSIVRVFYGVNISNYVLYILEIIALFVEGGIYKKYLEYKKINPFVVSFILNSASYFLGEVLNQIIF